MICSGEVGGLIDIERVQGIDARIRLELQANVVILRCTPYQIRLEVSTEEYRVSGPPWAFGRSQNFLQNFVFLDVWQEEGC